MAKDESGCNYKKPPEVFNTLGKIRAASYRVGFNIWDLYKPLDPDNNKVIAASKFVSVLGGPMKDIIGLTDEEITAVCKYFRMADGRVMYHQFCNLVHGGEEVDDTGLKEIASDSEIVVSNRLPPEEEKYLLMMLTKIAVIVNRKKMLLRPFFQDYALVKKGSGLVSRSRLARVLSQFGIHISSNDYNLLLRKYSRDSFTVSYTAFLADLEHIRMYLEEHDTLDVAGDLLPRFSGRLEGWELPQLPRPETVQGLDDSVGLPALNHPRYSNLISPREINFALDKIRKHLQRERLDMIPIFQKFDGADCGRVTQAQFRLVLAEVSPNSQGGNSLYMICEEIAGLGKLYADPADKERFLYRAFVRDIYKDLNPSDICKWPQERYQLLNRVKEMRYRERQYLDWAQSDHPAPPAPSVEYVLRSLKKKLIKRSLLLKPSFLKYDKDSLGVVNRENLRKSFIDNCILCTEDELKLLELNYIKGGVFNYTDMLVDLEKTELPDTIKQDDKSESETDHSAELKAARKRRETDRESDIIEVLAKIKRKIICDKRRTRDTLKLLDKEGSGWLSVQDFTTSLKECNLNLTEVETQTVITVFQEQRGSVKYDKFCKTVDEESERPCLVRLPLKEAMALKEHGPAAFSHPFLNYEERRIASVVAKKLSNRISLGQLDSFKKLDVHNSGLVSKGQLMSLLQSLGILEILTMDELDKEIKAFGVQPEGESCYYLDYLAFLKALDIVSRKYKAANA